MPKYCSVPNCRNDSESGDERKSFYKLPLHDPIRLQQWLRSMRRENYTPTRHQYICHEHFDPSCFKMRCGVRCLESDAVPTFFQEVEKRKAADHSERPPKRARTSGGQSLATLEDSSVASDAVEMESACHTVHLYEAVADSSQQGETCPVDPSLVRMYHSSTQAEPSSAVEDHKTGSSFPLTFFKTVGNCLDSDGGTGFVLMSECLAGEGQEELLNGIAAAILTQGHGLLVKGATLGGQGDAWLTLCVGGLGSAMEESCSEPEGQETQVLAYVESVPSLFPDEITSQLMFVPETVLSSALSSEPITSTVPIVSKHAAPSKTPAAAAEERPQMDTDGCEGDDELSDEDSIEWQDHQLEEHSYYKSSLSKEQLEVIVVELKKKVKILQQRHRLHLDKLVDLENTVSHLRQSNLLNEERLKLLERAYMQTELPASDAEETVAIIYEENDAAYLYAPLNEEM